MINQYFVIFIKILIKFKFCNWFLNQNLVIWQGFDWDPRSASWDPRSASRGVVAASWASRRRFLASRRRFLASRPKIYKFIKKINNFVKYYKILINQCGFDWILTNLVKSLLDYKCLTWNLMQFIKFIKTSITKFKFGYKF